MPTTLALIHTSPVLVPMFNGLAAKLLTDTRVFHMVDESLIKNTINAGSLQKGTIRRIVNQIESARDAGADVVLLTCSSIGAAVPVDSTMAIHVYRVLQESMNNVARHSGARSAQVTLRFDTAALELDVADDGRGIGAAEHRGLGLVAMRERAELLGGTLQFLSPQAGGTLVRLRVPLPERDDRPAAASIPA